MKPFSFSLSKQISEKGLSHKLRAALICERFKEMLAQDFSPGQMATVESVAYRKGACTIKSSSSALKGDVKLRQLGYIEALNKEFGPETVQKITFS